MAAIYKVQRILRTSHLIHRTEKCLFSTSSTLKASHNPAPVLASLRNDLKTAMRNKESAKLAVIRSLLADITNSSKTSTPIETDLQLLTLLRKRRAASQAAVDEFKEAGRSDLVTKEQEQIQVLDGYTQTLQSDMVSDEEIRAIVGNVVEELQQSSKKLGLGDVVKTLLGPGGKLDGRIVEKRTVVDVVQDFLGAKK